MILFLDFDGVLHPLYGRRDRSDTEIRLFEFMPRLETVLRDYPNVEIVISSSWRYSNSLDQLQAYFSPDIAQRIIDVTPKATDEDFNVNYYDRCRHHEVYEWLALNGRSKEPWVALDDDTRGFRRSHPVILCADGFRDAEEAALRKALERGTRRRTKKGEG